MPPKRKAKRRGAARKREAPKSVLSGAKPLSQVVTNLVSNAVKFTDNGEIIVTASLRGETNGQSTVQFSVSDSGVGIPSDKLESIFQEFTQADSSITRQYGGTGLGLTICRKIVRLMGGELEVSSAVGQGSEFRFAVSFPVDDEDPTELVGGVEAFTQTHWLAAITGSPE